MKLFVAKAALVMLPLVAFSTQSFAGQELVVAAVKQQDQQMSSHDMKHKQQALQSHHKAAVSVGIDDESIGSQFSIKELKKRYEE